MKVGDSVQIESDRTSGTITTLIQSDAEVTNLGVTERGVMIKSAPFGLLFVPESMFEHEQITFVRRSET